MSFNEFVPLGPAEVITERPFTHPEHSLADLAVLTHMCRRLAHALQSDIELSIATAACMPRFVHVQEECQRRHRILIVNGEALLAADKLAVVGFCGQKRSDLDSAVLHEMEEADRVLVTELTSQPYVLSYSSMEQPDGDWVNLVLMRSAQGIQHWRTSQRHAIAARELSPRYYASIRLHNAALSGGLFTPQLTLLCTKYYDFRTPQPWIAIREIALT